MALSFSLGRSQAPEYDVVIVGGGPAGASAALYAARADLRTVVLDKAFSAGALAITSKIANYPGIKEELTGAQLLQLMREQAESFGAEFVQAQVTASDLASDPKQLFTSAGTYTGRTVILATGRMGRKNRVPGEEEFLGRGVSYCATCDAAFFRDREVVVVGSNEHAVDEALFTARFARSIRLLAPGDKLTATEEQQEALAREPKITVEYRRPLRAVLGNGSVTGVRVAASGTEQVIPAHGVFIFLPGNAPILDFAGGLIETNAEGCVAVGGDRQTNVPGVFAVGDLLCGFVQQAVIAAADGAVAAMAAEKLIRGRKKVRSDWG
jgi:thioredoxin reductase (NADPH)